MTLHEFLNKKKSASNAHTHNKLYWEDKRRQWLSAVQELYRDIQKWLQTSIDQGVVTIKTTPIHIEEPYLGSYEVERLELQVGDETVYIEPQGVEFANILGEVVIRGDLGQAKLWLMSAPPEVKHVWYVVWINTGVNQSTSLNVSRMPHSTVQKLLVFNWDVFQEILMSIMRPDIDDIDED